MASTKKRKTRNIKFKDIVYIDGYKVKPGKYLIGENGEVYNTEYHGPMKPDPGARGYLRVALDLEDGSRRKFSIHRIVAEYFCYNDDPENKVFVDHLNDDKTDPYYTNLEWVTPKENAVRSYERGTSYTKGENCHLTVYSDEMVHKMCALLEQGKQPKEIMSELNLLDLDKYSYESYEYNKIRGYIKKLRTGTFRKDITKHYNLKGSTTIESTSK